MTRHGRRTGPDEQYVNGKGVLVTIWRGLTPRQARRLAASHRGTAILGGRGDRRTVTVREKPRQ